MDIIPLLPPLQAALNLVAASFAMTAYYHIRQKNRAAHRACMIAALVVSGFFLISYLYYHANVGNIPFAGEGLIRPIYFSILFSHVLLAALIVPLIVMTVTFALKGKFDRHRRIARWALPLWIYVSLTGVLIYVLAFHIYT